MKIQYFINDFKILIPELFFLLSILNLILFNVFLSTNSVLNFPLLLKSTILLSILILGLVFFLILNNFHLINISFLHLNFIQDYLSIFSKIIIILLAIGCFFVFYNSINIFQLNTFEYFIIALISILGILLSVSANELITAYLTIELQSLSFYLLAAYKRNSTFSTEAGLKYFILGSFASGLFLFGSSYIYGIFGSVNFDYIFLFNTFNFYENFCYKNFYFITNSFQNFYFIPLSVDYTPYDQENLTWTSPNSTEYLPLLLFNINQIGNNFIEYSRLSFEVYSCYSDFTNDLFDLDCFNICYFYGFMLTGFVFLGCCEIFFDYSCLLEPFFPVDMFFLLFLKSFLRILGQMSDFCYFLDYSNINCFCFNPEKLIESYYKSDCFFISVMSWDDYLTKFIDSFRSETFFYYMPVGFLYSLDDLKIQNFNNSTFYIIYLSIFSSIFIIVSLLFKLSAVPFHVWTPDVYEGSPLITTTLFAVISKLNIFILLIRILDYSFLQWFVHTYTVESLKLYDTYFIENIFKISGILSIMLGSILGLVQKKIKRLFAYSAISHTGYMLIGFSSISLEGLQSLFFYIIIYLITSLGLWTTILALKLKKVKPVYQSPKTLSEYQNISSSNYPLAICIALILFSLAGVPPFAGFYAKMLIFLSSINLGNYLLIFIAGLFSVVSAFYYLRIIKILFFDKLVFGILYLPIDYFKAFIVNIVVFINLFLFFEPNLLNLICYLMASSIFF
jgi:NADH:ubiquinone oxidoreductase subunit 2 (subunit N)